MKGFKHIFVLIIVILSFTLISFSVSWAQSSTELALRSVTYPIMAVGNTITGVVYIGDYGTNTAIVIALQGTPAGGDHPAHFHAGNCGSGGDIVVPLSNVEGDSGLSVTLSTTAYDTIVSGDHYLNVHASTSQIETIVACAEVGMGATALVGQMTQQAMTDMTRRPVTPGLSEEFTTPSTFSYGLFGVNGSPITGNLQITETQEGGTNLTVSLFNISEGRQYGAVLYEGDCGPDRPEVLTLNSVGAGSVDAFSSLTESLMNIQSFANGNYFLYIFEGSPGGLILACGEVGVGANR